MCGRYYVDDETAGEIERLVRQIDEKRKREHTGQRIQLYAKDIHPAQLAPVLTGVGEGLCCRFQRWGFPGYKGPDPGKQVIFNARSESALEKPAFRESMRRRRAVIPAAGFYEWNRRKEKNIFYRKGEPVLFMAGCFTRYEEEERFVILTTAANASMEPVHDRMPLILEREEIGDWLWDSAVAEEILHKRPCMLERRTDYEQMSLF